MISHLFNDDIGPLLFLKVGAAACLLYIFVTIGRNVVFGKLNAVEGPWYTKFSALDLFVANIQGRRAHRLLEFHQQYGPIVRIGPNEVSIADWKYYRPIYGNPKTVVKDVRFYGAASFVGKDNIFQMTNPQQHSARRKLSAEPYSLASITSLNPLVRQLANEFVEALIEQAQKSSNGTANAYELCGLFSFKVICKAAFNKNFPTITTSKMANDTDEAQKLLKAMDGSALTFIFDAAMPFLKASGFATNIPGVIGDCYRNHAYWTTKSREMVDHFLASSSQDSKFFLTPLANNLDTFLNRKLTHDEFVEEAMGMMFAGSGTTSSTLTYLLYAISRPENLHIQRRLREEVLAVEEGDMVGLRGNSFLNAVIDETFRLYPTIISTLPRVLLESMQVERHLLPAGTIVGMQNYVHHRDASVFPGPEQFRPERWLEATEEMKSSLTPFSVGRRNCIGQNLAWEELYLAVEAVMRAGVEVRLGKEMRNDDMDMEDRFNIAPKGRRLMLEVVRL